MRGRRSYLSARHSIHLPYSFHTSNEMYYYSLLNEYKCIIIYYYYLVFLTCTFKGNLNVFPLNKTVVLIGRFLSELGRHNYVTPTSYLELIAAFRLLLSQNRDTVMKAKKRYTNGLDKLAFAESQVQ